MSDLKFDGSMAIRTATLPEEWSRRLAEMPESGMGFQDVTLTMANGSKIHAIVLNGSVLETAMEVKVDEIKDISLNQISRWG